MAKERAVLVHKTAALTDPLTGLFNRRGFLEAAQKLIEGQRRKGQPVTVMMFDLDHFKSINDRFGHAVGDDALKKLSRELQRQLRAGDLAGRLGGDEFMLALVRADAATAEKVLQGIAEVKEGRSFCLSLPLDLPGGNVLNPRRLPPVLSPTGDENGWRFNFHTKTINPLFVDVASDDRVILTLQYSTQWDTLAHVGGFFDADGDGVPEPLYYNGFKAGIDVIGPQPDAGRDGCGHLSYAHKLGVENMAAKAIQGRAVMVDLEKHFGRDHKYVNYDDFRKVLEADKVVVEPGDMLLLYTGFTDEIVKMNKKVDPARAHAMCSVLDGRDKRLLQWITDSGLAALIADNYAVEERAAKPAPGYHGALLPLHEHCLFKNGIHLGEMFYFTELARWLRAHKRNRFLFTAPPLRLPGAVGSPATPI
ncbi:MAG: diguanylate cyclase, partial [Burkholderiales bacterium]